MRSTASLGISLVVAPVVALIALANFGLKPGMAHDASPYFFVGIPIIAAATTIAALRSDRHRTVALFFALMTFALATYALSIDAGSAVFAVPFAGWTVAGLITWTSPDRSGEAGSGTGSRT